MSGRLPTHSNCQHWLSCVTNVCHLCDHATVEDTFSTFNLNESTVGGSSEAFAAEAATPEQIRMSLKRLHNNLGHHSNQDLVRVLTDAGGSKEAIEEAKKYSCEVCIQRQRPTPSLPASAHQILDFGHRVGLDVKIVPSSELESKSKGEVLEHC